MGHQCEGLALGLEALQHLLAVHPGLDQLECRASANRPLLLHQIHDAHSALAQDLEHPVRTDTMRLFRRRSRVVVRLEGQAEETAGAVADLDDWLHCAST